MQDAVSLLKAQAPWMVAGTVAAAGLHQFDISTSRLDATKVVLEISNTSLVLCLALVCAWVTWTWLLTAKRKVYLLDFAVHRHADRWVCRLAHLAVSFHNACRGHFFLVCSVLGPPLTPSTCRPKHSLKVRVSY